jgi:hypothetical protein
MNHPTPKKWPIWSNLILAQWLKLNLLWMFCDQQSFKPTRNTQQTSWKN